VRRHDDLDILAERQEKAQQPPLPFIQKSI
jgi:hypothetical protein